MHTTISKFAEGKFRQDLLVGDKTFISDVSVEEGGEGAGPTPHDYLSMALAACTAMTLRMYAQRKSLPLTDAIVTVDVDNSLVGTVFKRTIELKGDLTEEQKTRLNEIADKCPIHKILVGKIEVESKLL